MLPLHVSWYLGTLTNRELRPRFHSECLVDNFPSWVIWQVACGFCLMCLLPKFFCLFSLFFVQPFKNIKIIFTLPLCSCSVREAEVNVGPEFSLCRGSRVGLYLGLGQFNQTLRLVAQVGRFSCTVEPT